MIRDVVQQFMYPEENLAAGEEVHCVDRIGNPQVSFARLVRAPDFRKAPEEVCVLVELELQILELVLTPSRGNI